MKLSMSLQNFRCFASAGPVHVAPITVLIGENSSGKTSFLAAFRQLMEMFSESSGASFNKEPYYLGSFEQIAHYRGGKAGRAKSFNLSIHVHPDEPQDDLIQGRQRTDVGVTHSLMFSKGTTRPELEEYKVFSTELLARFDLTSQKPKVRLQHEDGHSIELDSSRLPPSNLIRQEIGYLSYYLEDVLRPPHGDDTNRTGLRRSDVTAASQMLRSTSRFMNLPVFASAPVRIQPRRVYIPSELSSLNPGEQVPLQMAREKSLSADTWEVTRKRLAQFGRKSGLFEDVNVRRLGKSDSDPFQLQIKNRGPFSNIVDVGYGVSQALPLIYPLQSVRRYSVFLLQQPEVHLHPRAQAEFGSYIVELSAENTSNIYVIETHSDFILDRIRSEIGRGVLSNRDVSVLLFRRKGLEAEIINMGLDENGQVTESPEDYREFFLREQARTLGL